MRAIYLTDYNMCYYIVSYIFGFVFNFKFPGLYTISFNIRHEGLVYP